MLKNSASNLTNEHLQAPVSVDEIHSISNRAIHSPLDERSCWRILSKQFRMFFRRQEHFDNDTLQQSNETVNRSYTELNRLKIDNSRSMPENDGKSNIQKKTRQQKLFPFQRWYRTLTIKDKSSVSIACNGEYILLKQKPRLCLLDKELNIVKEISWTNEHVDFCWSSTLRLFILITGKTIFTLDSNTMILNPCQIDLINEKEWSSGSCTETSLYLSTSDVAMCLYEYRLQPTIEFIKQWQLFSLYARYEGILNFTCANGNIALIISNIHHIQRRLEVRLSATFDRLWSAPLDAVAHCCSINNDQWIVMELLKPRLLHFSSDGKILQEFKVKTSSANIIWNAIQLDKDTIATLTMDSLNLHKLP